MTEAEQKPEQAPLGRRLGFAIGALATGLLSGLASELLTQSLDSGGWIQRIGIALTVVLGVIAIVYNAPAVLNAIRRARSGRVVTTSELHLAAEEAEQWMVALGSKSGGMDAAEWYAMNADRLREVLQSDKPGPENADDLARICDALELWYVRQADPDALLKLSEFLRTVGEGCGRSDLKELAAARTATAYRMIGDLRSATLWLGISSELAPNGRTAAAMTTRRHVERALSSLHRAAGTSAGSDRDEALETARNRLDDARLRRPGPDLTAEITILVNLAVVQLYRHDAEGAVDHLHAAIARATAAGDVSGEAHASELIGVAAWMRKNPREAEGWWRHAAHLNADIDDREAQARCLQHLGSAQAVAGNLKKAAEYLEDSAGLRTSESPLLARYLKEVGDTSSAPPSPGPPPHLPWPARFRRWLHDRRSR
ncbi:hypothetical protein GCM10009745_26710 [Kribbella yunnanensis]|uniref:Tetratricopeptide repeat protein n=1 Tax=Kribbella yunnanensis TaxID=190194 RepID=A0ABN2H319_9ACTN